MAIKDILKFVEKQTAGECEKILSEARAAVKRIETETEERRKSDEAAFRKKLEVAREIIAESAMRESRMRLRLETLNAKKRLLDEIYNEHIIKKLNKLPEDKTIALYEGLLKHIPPETQSPDAVLLVSPSETTLWKKIKKRPLVAAITEDKSITKGFIYKTQESLWDFTMENLLLEFRSQTESDAAKKLFDK